MMNTKAMQQREVRNMDLSFHYKQTAVQLRSIMYRLLDISGILYLGSTM